MSDHSAGWGGWRIGRLAGLVLATASAAAVAAVLYLWLLWLPEADPAVVVWPQGLALLLAPSAVAFGLRGAPNGIRVAAFAACSLLSVVLVFAGAVVLHRRKPVRRRFGIAGDGRPVDGMVRAHGRMSS